MRRMLFVFLLEALLLLLGYYWLGLGEARISSLVWSLLVALAVFALACWLHGAMLVRFRLGKAPGGHPGARTALRNLVPIMAAAAVLLALYLLLAKWADYSSTPAAKVASWLTLKTRKPVKPASILKYFNAALWIVRWWVIPVLVLPVLGAVAALGWRAMRPQRVPALNWLATPLLLVCAFWLPLKIVGWVPYSGGFFLEAVSFVLRAAVAFYLFVGSLVALAWVTSGGSPRFSQPKTVVSP